ncbi:MAG: alpha/beta hydrolase [Bacteroidota bacterium]
MKFIDLSGYRMSYRTAGSPQDTALLLLHGNSTSSELFNKQVSEGIKGLYLLAPDFPGHGSSETPQDQELYSLQSLALAIKEFLQVLSIDKLIVYGVSLGGHVAMELAAICPDMIGMMISGSPPMPLPLDMAPYFTDDPIISLPFQPDISKEQAKAWADACIYQDTKAKILIAEMMLNTNPLFRTLFSAHIMAAHGTSDQRKLIENLHIPVSILHGKHEWLVKKEPLTRLKINNYFYGKIIDVPNSVHVPALENSAFFNKTIKAFSKFCLDQP